MTAPIAFDLSRFPPDPVRAAALDQHVRLRLADSLAEIFDACRDALAWDRTAEAALLAAVRAHPVAPAVFALYTDLVEAVFADDLVRAHARLHLLFDPALRQQAAPRVVTFRAADFAAGVPELYRQIVDDDAGLPMQLTVVDDAELARAAALAADTGALLRQAAPALAGEIVVLAHETVMVADARRGRGVGGFDGATTFYLWGAILLNAARLRDRVGLAGSLAHEAAHAYLLGASLGCPLVENDPAERHASPLRADPRPMEGIVHASFVLARMVWCQDALLASGGLDVAETVAATAARTRNAARFAASENLVATQARFTADGAVLWHAARDWMCRRG